MVWRTAWVSLCHVVENTRQLLLNHRNVRGPRWHLPAGASSPFRPNRTGPRQWGEPPYGRRRLSQSWTTRGLTFLVIRTTPFVLIADSMPMISETTNPMKNPSGPTLAYTMPAIVSLRTATPRDADQPRFGQVSAYANPPTRRLSSYARVRAHVNLTPTRQLKNRHQHLAGPPSTTQPHRPRRQRRRTGIDVVGRAGTHRILPITRVSAEYALVQEYVTRSHPHQANTQESNMRRLR